MYIFALLFFYYWAIPQTERHFNDSNDSNLIEWYPLK